MKKTLASILIILLALTSFSACEPAHFKYQKTFIGAFDTVTVITGYARNSKTFDETATAIYNELEEYSRLFDIYYEYSNINNIKTINENAGKAPVTVDERIIDFLDYSVKMYDLTNGTVNIAMGSVLSLWHDCREDGINNPDAAKLPEASTLQKASAHTDVGNVIIDKENSTVFISDADTSLDVGATAKGYAVEQVCRKYDNSGFSATVSVGGNVRTVGNSSWNIGIKNPNSDGAIKTVTVDGAKSVVTSGTYERYYVVDGKKYNHIIDPETLYPAEKYLSVTVITDDSALADALSTALLIMNYEDGKKLVESLQNVSAYWITEDGEEYSVNFEDKNK